MLAHLGAMPRKTRKVALPPSKIGGDALAILRENLGRAAGDNMKRFSLTGGVGETFVRDVVKRGQDPSASKLITLAQKHHLSLDELIGLRPHEHQIADESDLPRVLGEVGAGKWHEVDGLAQIDFEQEPSPFPPDPKYPISAQFDLVVRGSSINRFARDGMRLRCVDIAKAAIDPYDEDLVIVRRTKGDGLVETTAKRIRRRGPVIELWPDSDDPRWQTPERIDTRHPPAGEAQIVALVLYAYSPIRPRRR